jgi:hypothetical protein
MLYNLLVILSKLTLFDNPEVVCVNLVITHIFLGGHKCSLILDKTKPKITLMEDLKGHFYIIEVSHISLIGTYMGLF